MCALLILQYTQNNTYNNITIVQVATLPLECSWCSPNTQDPIEKILDLKKYYLRLIKFYCITLCPILILNFLMHFLTVPRSNLIYFFFFWRLTWIFQTMQCAYFHIGASGKMAKTLPLGFWLKSMQRVFVLDPKQSGGPAIYSLAAVNLKLKAYTC